ncbi:rhomboid family intramembrane serine protease [Methylocapsa aurea]|uniref:rhomboid family intramembrane serine protease n=1 Tax=Methylocapsa aurea TaxID=663610 RepID=UPI00068D6FD6|nr:rhomboid family intramembrane serine protease [Methylocapsa aurea]
MRHPKERIFNVPTVILYIIAALVLIEAICDFLPPEIFLKILQRFAFVPGRFTFAFDPDRVFAANDDLTGPGFQLDRYFLGDGRAQWWTLLTYALLHGGWLHVGMNSLWFVAFGSAVARRFGTPRFLVFCVAAALAGAATHFLTHMDSLQPVIGASAVVSGAMAAAVRFVFQPGAPLGEALGFSERAEQDLTYRLPALPLREIVSNRGAISFLAFWFLANFLSGAMSGPLGVTDATIAWEAHIGGFLVGLLAFQWFDPPPIAVHRSNPAR